MIKKMNLIMIKIFNSNNNRKISNLKFHLPVKSKRKYLLKFLLATKRNQLIKNPNRSNHLLKSAHNQISPSLNKAKRSRNNYLNNWIKKPSWKNRKKMMNIKGSFLRKQFIRTIQMIKQTKMFCNYQNKTTTLIKK